MTKVPNFNRGAWTCFDSCKANLIIDPEGVWITVQKHGGFKAVNRRSKKAKRSWTHIHEELTGVRTTSCGHRLKQYYIKWFLEYEPQPADQTPRERDDSNTVC